MLVYYEVVEFVSFFIFKDCLRILVMFFNVDMCKTALIAGESTDYAIIFIELLKFFLGSANYHFWDARVSLATF